MNSTRIGTLLWAIMMFFLLTLLFGDHSGTFRRGRSKNRVVRSAAWGFCKRRDFGRLSPKSDLKAELEQLTMDARRSPQRIVDAHPPDQRAQVRVDLRTASKGAGFPTQYQRKPARCHRTRVSGRTIVMALRTDGNHRYSWMKNKRSLFVSPTRPRTFRRNMIS